MEKTKEVHEQGHSMDWHRLGTWGALAIMAYYLITEHRAHVIQFLPYAILLACPLMHIFMHHGHHTEHSQNEVNKEKERT